MLKRNDKITLTLINAKDINGNIIPFNLSLPITNNNIQIPDNIVSVDVFEYQEGTQIGGSIIFKICIGKKDTIDNLLDNKEITKLEIKNRKEIKSLNTPVCYQKTSKKAIIYAIANKEDIIVNNKEKMILIIEELSKEFENLYKSIEKIRKLKISKL